MDRNRATDTFRVVCTFYMEKWVTFWLFYSQNCFDHISLVFHHFELIFFKRKVYIWRRDDGVFLGIIVAAATDVGKRVSILGLSKLTQVLGNFIFQMVQKCNRIQLISYILSVFQKIFFLKVKGGGYRKEKTKNDKKY